MNDQKQKEVVLSGIRATGSIHLGNYSGAIQQFVKFQDDPDVDCFFFIANLHSITEKIEPDLVLKGTRDITRVFLAAGLDPEKSTIYAQSSIPELCELSWLFNCMVTVPTVANMPHFKEKKDLMQSRGTKETAGLLTYPILMAADILGVNGTIVPVGKDQEYHVELARDIARSFNSKFGDLFTLPAASIGDFIPSLQGSGKMGKSSGGQTIAINIAADELKKIVLTAMTDPARARRTDPGDPRNCNVASYHHIFSSTDEVTWAEAGCMNASIGCIDCKKVVLKNLEALIAPLRERYEEVARIPDKEIDEILHEGGIKARKIVMAVVGEAKERMGLPFF